MQRRDPNEVPASFISTPAELAPLADALRAAVRVAVDTETHKAVTFFDGAWAALRVISVATKDANGNYAAFVIDARDVGPEHVAPVMELVEEADGWNANFDDRVLRLYGAPVKKWRDAMFNDGVLHSGVPGFGMQPAGENGSKGDDFGYWHALSWASLRYTGIEMTGKGTTQTSYDGTSDLSDEQKRYPAHDALITIWVAEEIDRQLELAGLEIPSGNEHYSRPFNLTMMVKGFRFDSPAWDSEVVSARTSERADALKLIADLTGGPKLDLFGENNEPAWDVNSELPTKAALNKYAVDAVRAFKGGSLLGPTDKVDKTTLKQIEHPLAQALLVYRAKSKVVTTYGDNLNKYIDDDLRVHAEYVQGGLVATGRMASRNPNAQNLDPGMKRYMRPVPRVCADGTTRERVIVLADLSQAEVRVLAQLSQEQNLINLFKQGGDFHTLNAGKMFQVDMDALEKSDPDRFSQYRTTTKGTSFGIPYGLGAYQLATNLSVNMGVPTTPQEATAHIKAYLKANPKVRDWLEERDAFIKELAENPPAVDWKASLELYEIWQKGDAKRKEFKRINKRPASMRELAESIMQDYEVRDRLRTQLGRACTDEELEAERQRQAAELTWAFGFNAPVVLLPSGEPLAWESRTPTGRRRLFMVPMDRVSKGAKGKFEGVLTSFALLVAASDNPQGAAMRDAFAAQHSLALPKGVKRCTRNPGEDGRAFNQRQRDFARNERMESTKVFEGGNRHLKYELLKDLVNQVGLEGMTPLLNKALGEQISGMRNQYRNHPIQGLVADIMLEAMGDLHVGLASFEEAYPVQQVHDSIAIECDAADARAIRDLLKSTMEASLAKWCPDVPSKADANICSSMSDKYDTLSDEALEALIG
jgi:DNA polymerase-1